MGFPIMSFSKFAVLRVLLERLDLRAALRSRMGCSCPTPWTPSPSVCGLCIPPSGRGPQLACTHPQGRFRKQRLGAWRCPTTVGKGMTGNVLQQPGRREFTALGGKGPLFRETSPFVLF